MAKWKYGPCLFDLLMKVIQGQKFIFGSTLDPKEALMKNEIRCHVGGNMEKQDPGSYRIPTQFLRFHSSSSALLTSFLQTRLNCYGGNLLEVRRNWNGSEELAWNKIWTRVPVSLCSHHRSINFSFASDLPGGQKMVKKLGTLNDHPK